MKIVKYQNGGVAPAAPVEAPQMDPIAEIAQYFMQGLQNQDCAMLAQGAEAFLALIQQAQGEAQPPVDQAPQGQPVFKKGGKLVRRKCGRK